MAKQCCGLAHSTKLDAYLFKVFTSNRFSKDLWLYSTGSCVSVAWLLLRLAIAVFLMVVLYQLPTLVCRSCGICGLLSNGTSTRTKRWGCPISWTNNCLNSAMVHWVSICHLVGCLIAECHLSVHLWFALVFPGRCDGRMPLSGESKDAFESSIRAIVREAVGQQPVLVGWCPSSRHSWMLCVNQCPCFPISGQ